MYELTVLVDFEAAHRIIDYPGKCDRLHGHNWSVEATIVGEQLNALGMLVDFKEVKQAVNDIAEDLDHYYLNEKAYFQQINPTAENIAKYFFDKLEQSECFSEGIHVKKIKIWESPKSAVTYSRGE